MSADEQNPGEPAPAGQQPEKAAPRRRRPARGAMESLLRIVHGLEVAGLAFGTLAVWGVSRDWPQPVAFAAVAVLLLATMRLLSRPWGWIVSLVAQLAVAALTFIEPVWGVVALVFVILWIYCFVKARGIERNRRAAGLDPYGPPGA
ncbi:DUF4233 domain-containing protein [Agrococcus baldri]|uniref:DUF4233 domain-containing protein n=1 Tax=Agrococcus baldri TaxID=153730 RepID=A0AA87RMI6_9MICO|nr:DUF4233 domain-containing protein [Agrococcus baldri]GEK81638.1 hypothetical protein ABA31_29890 [Agrococcus baldri]